MPLRLATASLLAALAVAAASVAPRQVSAEPAGRRPAQQSFDSWLTLASGDEVLVLAPSPSESSVLWAGTEGGGLVRWDVATNQFSQFLFPQQVGLASNEIRDIAFDSLSTPWLATSAGVTYAGGSNWTAYDFDDELPSEDVTAIAVTADDTVWIGTRESGLAELPPGSQIWSSLLFDEDELGVGANAIASMAVSPVDDTLWVAHGRASSGEQPALSVYDPATGEWEHISKAEVGSDSDLEPPTDQILDLAFDEAGVLWAGTWAEGLLVFDGDTWGQFEESDGLCGKNVWSVAVSGSEVWVACARVAGASVVGTGASVWDGTEWTTYNVADGLPTDTVVSIALIRGVAYLGTNGPGIHGSGIVPVSTFVEDPLTTAPFAPFSNDITAIAFDDLGVPWIGTRGAGLMARQAGQWRVFTVESTGGGLAGDLITDLAWANGDLWIAATKSIYEGGVYIDGGVSRYTPDTGEWLTLTDGDDLPDTEASSIAVAENGQVWIGFGIANGDPGLSESYFQGDGIAVYDPASDEVVAYYGFDDTSGDLIGDTVTALAADGNTIWAGASYHRGTDGRNHGGGASRFTSGDWISWAGGEAGFKSYHGTGNPADRDPFITGDVRSIGVGPDGAVFAGTWDLTSGTLQNIWPFVNAVVNEWTGSQWVSTTWNGSGWVSAVAIDADDRLWAGTTRGHALAEYEPGGVGLGDTALGGVHVKQDGSWLDLTPLNSGLASRAITSIAMDPTTGDVWVGTENSGLSVYYPGVIPPTVTPGGPTSTPRPTSTPTSIGISTVPPTNTLPPGQPTATPVSGGGAPSPTDTPEPPREVPEPSTMVLLGAGLAGLAAWRRRQQGAGQEDR